MAADWNGPREDTAVAVSGPTDGVAVITLLSTPLGVLREAVKRSMRIALSALESDPSVHALVITGSGRAFSVGSDVREFTRDAAELARAVDLDQGLNDALERSRLPIIAACNGLTLGGGLELALACDVRLGATTARFGMPELLVGAVASGGGTQRLPRVIGKGRALDLLLTGRIIDAEEANRIGLVDRLVPDAMLAESAHDLASAMAATPVNAASATKRSVYSGQLHGQMVGQALEKRLSIRVGISDDAAEGQAAFLGKRRAEFAPPDLTSLAISGDIPGDLPSIDEFKDVRTHSD